MSSAILQAQSQSESLALVPALSLHVPSLGQAAPSTGLNGAVSNTMVMPTSGQPGLTSTSGAVVNKGAPASSSTRAPDFTFAPAPRIVHKEIDYSIHAPGAKRGAAQLNRTTERSSFPETGSSPVRDQSLTIRTSPSQHQSVVEVGEFLDSRNENRSFGGACADFPNTLRTDTLRRNHSTGTIARAQFSGVDARRGNAEGVRTRDARRLLTPPRNHAQSPDAREDWYGAYFASQRRNDFGLESTVAMTSSENMPSLAELREQRRNNVKISTRTSSVPARDSVASTRHENGLSRSKNAKSPARPRPPWGAGSGWGSGSKMVPKSAHQAQKWYKENQHWLEELAQQQKRSESASSFLESAKTNSRSSGHKDYEDEISRDYGPIHANSSTYGGKASKSNQHRSKEYREEFEVLTRNTPPGTPMGSSALHGMATSSSLRHDKGLHGWPVLGDGLEPVGPMLRSLEFKVGALFELLDLQLEHQPKDETSRGSAVQEVISRKRETVLETLDAVKETLWWQQKRHRRIQRRQKDQSYPALEPPQSVSAEVPQAEVGATSSTDLDELAELKAQLKRRVDEVISGSPARGAMVARSAEVLDSRSTTICSPAKLAESPLMSQKVQPTDQIIGQESPTAQTGARGPCTPTTRAVGLPAQRWVSSGRSEIAPYPAVAALEAEIDNDAKQETSLAGWRGTQEERSRSPYAEERSLSPALPARVGEAQQVKPLVMTETVFHYSR